MKRVFLMLALCVLVSACCPQRLVLDNGPAKFTLEQYCRSINVESVDIDTSVTWDVYNKYGKLIYENIYDPEYSDDFEYITFFKMYGGRVYGIRLWNNELVLYKKPSPCNHY